MTSTQIVDTENALEAMIKPKIHVPKYIPKDISVGVVIIIMPFHNTTYTMHALFVIYMSKECLGAQ